MTRLAKKLKSRKMVGALLALALGGCAAGAAPGEDVGTIQIALTVAPADALCLRLTLDFANGAPNLVTTKALSTTNAALNTVTLASLPLGEVGILGEAFNVACTAITPATPATWVADRQVATLVPDFSPAVALTLRRTGRVNIGVDFVAGATVDEVKLPAPSAKLAAAGAAMLMTLPNYNAVWTATGPLDAKFLTSAALSPRYLAVAADGTIFVSTASPAQVLSFTSAGVPKATMPLVNISAASDLLVDAANTLWVASSTTGYVDRFATATTTPSPALPIGTPASAATGLALASDGSLRLAGQPNMIYTLPAFGGSPIGSVIVNPPPRDVVFDAAGTLWFTSTTGAGLSKVVGTVSQTVWPGTGEGSLVSTSKGIVAGLSNGQLVLVTPAGAVQLIQLPAGTTVSGLAVSSTGKVWVADASQPRALIVTLP